MDRRRFLGLAVTAGTAALAGCGGSEYSDWLSVRSPSPETLVRMRVPDVDRQASRRLVSAIVSQDGLNATDPAWVEVPNPDYYYFLDQPTYFDGAVYNFTASENGTVVYDVYTVDLERQAEQTVTPTGTVVDFEDLPAIDQRALAPAFNSIPGGPVTTTERPSETPATTTNRAGVPFSEARFEARYRTNETSSSRLVDSNVTAIRINGTRYAFRMPLVEQNRTVDRVQYRIAERWTLEEYAERLREEFLFTLSGLSDAERKLLENAIEQGEYEITADVEDAAASLVEQLEAHRPIGQSVDDVLPAATPPYRIFEVAVWLLRYDGSDYLVQHTEKTYD